MKLLIVLQHRFELWQAPDWFAQRLQGEFPQLTVVHLSTYEHVADEIADADIVIAWSLRGEQIRAARKLKWIHSTATAVHALMSDELRSRDIVVTNARDVHGPVVAEHAMALTFSLARHIPQAVRYQQKKHWAQQNLWRASPRPRELQGATMTIIGMGGIGQPLAKLARSLNMRVLGVREHPERPCEGVQVMYGIDNVETALREADFVVLAVPVTPKTHLLMNARRLAELRPHACLINVARGVLVVEAALVAALQARSFAAAALDVTTEEPLPPESLLWEMENVLITPHIAGLTEAMWERHYRLFAENLRRFFNGEPLAAIVDKEKGY
jgi:phosphoglycerate dehydrogenase-like enzyme